MRADFNGLFDDALWISHGNTVEGLSGRQKPLTPGMVLTVAEEDDEDGWTPAWLVATGGARTAKACAETEFGVPETGWRLPAKGEVPLYLEKSD